MWTDADEVWNAELFVSNLENDRIYQNVLVGPRALATPLYAWYGAPRIWGMRIGFRY